MGSLQKRGRCFRLSYYVDGKRRWESVRTSDREEAERILIEREKGEILPVNPVRRAIPAAEHSGIYFLRAESNGLVKIGRSTNVGERIAALITTSPEKLAVIARIPTAEHITAERLVHAFLADKRKHGEWFQVTTADIEAAIRHWFLSTATEARP